MASVPEGSDSDRGDEKATFSIFAVEILASGLSPIQKLTWAWIDSGKGRTRRGFREGGKAIGCSERTFAEAVRFLRDCRVVDLDESGGKASKATMRIRYNPAREGMRPDDVVLPPPVDHTRSGEKRRTKYGTRSTRPVEDDGTRSTRPVYEPVADVSSNASRTPEPAASSNASRRDALNASRPNYCSEEGVPMGPEVESESLDVDAVGDEVRQEEEAADGLAVVLPLMPRRAAVDDEEDYRARMRAAAESYRREVPVAWEPGDAGDGGLRCGRCGGYTAQAARAGVREPMEEFCDCPF